MPGIPVGGPSYTSDVVPLGSINRAILRHRRLAATVGTIVVLGVVGLNAHEALPEHHEHHAVATMCVAALSIAVLACLRWGASPPSIGPRRAVRGGRERPSLAEPAAVLSPPARAGPTGLIPLRR